MYCKSIVTFNNELLSLLYLPMKSRNLSYRDTIYHEVINLRKGHTINIGLLYCWVLSKYTRQVRDFIAVYGGKLCTRGTIIVLPHFIFYCSFIAVCNDSDRQNLNCNKKEFLFWGFVHSKFYFGDILNKLFSQFWVGWLGEWNE